MLGKFEQELVPVAHGPRVVPIVHLAIISLPLSKIMCSYAKLSKAKTLHYKMKRTVA